MRHSRREQSASPAFERVAGRNRFWQAGDRRTEAGAAPWHRTLGPAIAIIRRQCGPIDSAAASRLTRCFRSTLLPRRLPRRKPSQPVSTTACAVSCIGTRTARPHAAGDPLDMLIDGLYRHNVGYVVIDEWDGSGYQRNAVGTAFFVEENLDQGFGVVHYAVTCRHVIEGVRNNASCSNMFLRVNDGHGNAEDIRSCIGDWIMSENTDVAATRIDFPPEISFWAYPMQGIRGSSVGQLLPGHDVFFIGLFEGLPGIGSVQAIVRSGRVAMPSTSVPIIVDPSSPEDSRWVDAHLVESWCWGGESGSPVFVYEQSYRVRNTVFDTGFPIGHLQRNDLRASEVLPALLGILHGHFQIPVPVKNGGADGGSVDMNSGLAIVIPAPAITATLMNERLVEDRNHILEERRARAVVLPKPDAG